MAKKRRTPEQIQADKEQEWINLASTGFCGTYKCKCGKVETCRGSRKGNMRCRSCF